MANEQSCTLILGANPSLHIFDYHLGSQNQRRRKRQPYICLFSLMVEHRTCNADMVVQFYQKAPIKYIINPVYNCNIMWLGIIR